MAYNYKGHTSIDLDAPRAVAQCDCCGFVWMHSDLRAQQEWSGVNLITKNILVCPTCWSPPSSAYQTVVIGPDPVPISNPRPLTNRDGQTDYRSTMGADRRITEDDDPRVPIDNPEIGSMSQ